MKVAYCSDLHFEFYAKRVNYGLPDEMMQNTENADVLVLAGDLYSADLIESDKVAALFSQLSSVYPRVLTVLGNHEHYGGDFATTAARVTAALEQFPNVLLLDKQGTTIDGVRFFGGTKWTDLDKNDPLTVHRVRRVMNDYAQIKDSAQQSSHRTIDSSGGVQFHSRPGMLTPETTMADQKAYLAALRADLAALPNHQFFVISHHTPSYRLCDDMYARDSSNPAYHDRLDQFIIDTPQIKHWVCGHTHGQLDVILEHCTLLLNARGYSHERASNSFTLKYISI